MELPKKLPIEVFGDQPGKDGKRALLLRFVLTDVKSHDDALARARGRAERDGRQVQSVNFRASRSGRAIEAIIVYVKEG